MADAPKPAPPEDNPEDNYLGSPLANPFNHFEGDYKRLVRHKAMVRDASNAIKNYKEIDAETALGQKKQTDAARKAEKPPVEKKAKGGSISAKYMSFSKTGKPAGMKPVTKMARGGGIESRGKTKGRFV